MLSPQRITCTKLLESAEPSIIDTSATPGLASCHERSDGVFCLGEDTRQVLSLPLACRMMGEDEMESPFSGLKQDADIQSQSTTIFLVHFDAQQRKNEYDVYS